MSDDPGVFYKLAKTISAEERSDLLGRLSARAGESSEPLIPLESEVGETETVEEHFNHMGFFQRFVLFLRSMFSQREILELVEDAMIDKIARTMSQAHPDIFQHRSGTLGAEFLNNFNSLRTKLQVLLEALRNAFSGERRDFVVFLGTALLPLEHEKLTRASDPSYIAAEERNDEFELKKRVQMATRDSLTEINKEAKSHMYAMYRALFFLNELVSLPFMRAGIGDSGDGTGIEASRYRNSFSELCDVLSSLKVRPSKTAIEAVLLFRYRNRTERDEEFEEQYKVEVTNANAAIQELQNFCTRVPLIDLLKVLNRNPAYVPDTLGGGEDWFSLYRQYWEKNADIKIDEYLQRRRFEQFQADAEALLGRDEAIQLPRYHSRDPNNGIPVKYAESSKFLLLFAERLFPQKFSVIIKSFLVNGEFYKNQNREELTDAFNGLASVGTKIRAVDGMLRPESEVGGSIERIVAEPKKNSDREAQISTLLGRVDVAMEDVIRRSVGYLDSVTNVAGGLLRGESSGTFDTLANINSIGGSENRILLQQLDSTISELDKVKRLLHRIFDLEKNSE